MVTGTTGLRLSSLGLRPSEELGVTCRFCALCLDEAVEIRVRLMRKNAQEQAELDAELKSLHEQAKAQPEWGGV